MAPKPISSPVPVAWYPSLAVLMLSVGLLVTASFFMVCMLFDVKPCHHLFGGNPFMRSETERYEATSSRRNRSLSKEIATGAVASVFLGFGSLFLLLATGVYV
ncbi:uncharacterized protein [Elaeis guineensis]|uniref:Dolichyl-diphosphooligosaccharide-protein glycosyltransferase subunit OST5 n=1 Tax=Elaeis guineensis var. tenera TaxID=51953 RepID=A0A6I9QUC6_ELAGV|nr:transmembrane protein 258 isoform X1 [Elaeis guineensis]